MTECVTRRGRGISEIVSKSYGKVNRDKTRCHFCPPLPASSFPLAYTSTFSQKIPGFQSGHNSQTSLYLHLQYLASGQDTLSNSLYLHPQHLASSQDTTLKRHCTSTLNTWFPVRTQLSNVTIPPPLRPGFWSGHNSQTSLYLHPQHLASSQDTTPTWLPVKTQLPPGFQSGHNSHTSPPPSSTPGYGLRNWRKGL